MKIGIVATVFINNDAHLALGIRAMEGVDQQETTHEIYKVAVVNKAEREEDKKFLEQYFGENVIYNDQNILARSWNIGIEHCLNNGCDYVVVMNIDILMQSNYIENLVSFAKKYPHYIVWSGKDFEGDLNWMPFLSKRFSYFPDIAHYSCFMVNKNLFNLVGKFDEQFIPVYYEDCDMNYRIKLAGYHVAQTCTAIFWHYGSATMKLSLQMKTDDGEMIQNGAIENHKKYIAKWGGAPGKEVFLTPYNNG